AAGASFPWDVAHALRESPAGAEGIGDLSVPLAPEGVGERLPYLAARVDRSLPERFDVVGVEVEHRRCSPDAERGEHAQLRKLVGQHHGGVAEPELACISLPLGISMRPRSSAPSARAYHSAAWAASRTTRWGVIACI